MKIVGIATTFLLGASLTTSLSLRSAKSSKDAISRRGGEAGAKVLYAPLSEHFDEGLLNYLEKRRGGGGGSGGGGSGGGGGGGGRSGGSSSSGSSGSSSGGGRSGSTGSASSSSSRSPGYGGGRYYGGGSSSAYRSGGRSPAGILPFALGGAALGIFPGLWLYGAYGYNYNNPYNFRNRSESNNQNQSLPVTCLCQEYSACGCDDNNNSTFLDSVVGNGSLADEDSEMVHVGIVNGTKTIILNGTLPNGTDTDNSTDSSTDNSVPASAPTSVATRTNILENAGFWLVGAIVGATLWLL